MKSAPKHLTKDTRKWVNYVIRNFDLRPHHELLLVLAGEALDRSIEARDAINRDGLMLIDRFDQSKLNPLVNVERDSRLAFCRILRELQLEDIEAPEAARIPVLYKGTGG